MIFAPADRADTTDTIARIATTTTRRFGRHRFDDDHRCANVDERRVGVHCFDRQLCRTHVGVVADSFDG